jgi:hypothetical protein
MIRPRREGPAVPTQERVQESRQGRPIGEVDVEALGQVVGEAVMAICEDAFRELKRLREENLLLRRLVYVSGERQ